MYTKYGFHLNFADSTYNLLIPLTVCDFRLQLRIPQQLILNIHMSQYLYVESTDWSGFRKHGCGFRRFSYFWSDLNGKVI